MPPPWLAEMERNLAADDSGEALSIAVVVLAAVAGANVPLGEHERRAAGRRALLLLAAGGDPDRGLDLDGRAVTALADELRTVDRQLALEDGLRELRLLGTGLPHVTEALRGLMDAPDVAWRAYAAALLAEELGGGE